MRHDQATLAAIPETNPDTPPGKHLWNRLGPHGLFWSISAAVVVVILLFSWLLFQPSGASGAAGFIAVGHSAPAFSLPDTTGRAITLAQQQGHPVILNFWATYCLPCRTETPLLQRTYQTQQAHGLIILGIDQGEPVDAIQQFGHDYSLTYPLLADTQLTVNHLYGVTGLPVSYFLDAQGHVRYSVNGALTTAAFTTGLRAIGLTTP